MLYPQFPTRQSLEDELYSKNWRCSSQQTTIELLKCHIDTLREKIRLFKSLYPEEYGLVTLIMKAKNSKHRRSL